MDQIFSVSDETLYTFMEAAEGNYRNAIYVECTGCSCGQQANCRDFLFIPGYDCRPILLPVFDAEQFFGFRVDRTDCACNLSYHSFLRLYRKWLELVIPSSDPCPIQQLLALSNRKNWKKFPI